MTKSMTAAAVVLTATMAQGALAQDWSGFYGGLGFGRSTGTYTHYDSGVFGQSGDVEGSQPSGFLGYNRQHGNWVYGGELAYGRSAILVNNNPVYNIDEIVDVRGRLGYAAGPALIYGSLGWTSAAQSWDGSVTNSPLRVDGMSFGLGLDMMVSERVFVGVEIQRRMHKAEEGELGGYPIVSTETETDTLAMRLGLNF